jgi:short-subunit dehydrogenase
MRISGSTVLLTGATGGLGQAIARALGAGGAKLLLTGRRSEILAPLAAELDARALEVDLGDRAAVERLIEEAGAVDILVANAALPASGRLEGFSQEEIDRALEVNLRAPIALTRALMPEMVSRGSGHLLYISSLSGKAATVGTTVYAASKFGLRGFAGALRADLRSSGVGVSAVFPGFIRDAGMFAEAEVELPPGVGTRSPDDVARAVVLAVEENRGEIDVAPLQMRVSAKFAGFAPETAAALARRFGGDRVAAEMESGQRSKR